MVPRSRGVGVVCRTAQLSRVARKDPLKYKAFMEQVRREAETFRQTLDADAIRRPVPGRAWACLAVCAATIPFLPGLAGSRVI